MPYNPSCLQILWVHSRCSQVPNFAHSQESVVFRHYIRRLMNFNYLEMWMFLTRYSLWLILYGLIIIVTTIVCAIIIYFYKFQIKNKTMQYLVAYLFLDFLIVWILIISHDSLSHHINYNSYYIFNKCINIFYFVFATGAVKEKASWP